MSDTNFECDVDEGQPPSHRVNDDSQHHVEAGGQASFSA